MNSRRIFLRDGGIAVLGLSLVPGFVYRAAMAAKPKLGKKKTLITIFQRGGADGLNLVVPFGDKDYYSLRPSIGIRAPSKEGRSAIDLDGYFGLHPSMESLLPLYKAGDLAIIHATGSPHPTRSHFEAQDYMESAVPGDKTIHDGWLNRYLVNNPDPDATTFRGVSMGPVLPRSLSGSAPALALGSMISSEMTSDTREMYQTLYDEESDALLSGTSRELFEAMDQLKELNPQGYKPDNGANYQMQGQNGVFARNMSQVAQLIKADLGLELAFVDIGGWDTHSNQEGRFQQLLTSFSRTLATFYEDLGDRMEDVLILTMSEFGRTARENGNAGTDHGKATVMFLIGGSVQGGAVYGEWPGVAPDVLNENRDLAMTTDFRDVFAEVLDNFLDCENPGVVFPDLTLDPARYKGVIAS